MSNVNEEYTIGPFLIPFDYEEMPQEDLDSWHAMVDEQCSYCGGTGWIHSVEGQGLDMDLVVEPCGSCNPKSIPPSEFYHTQEV